MSNTENTQSNINLNINQSMDEMKTLLDDVGNFHTKILQELKTKNEQISLLTKKIDQSYPVFEYLEATIENLNNRLDEGGPKKTELLNNCADVIRRLKDIMEAKN